MRTAIQVIAQAFYVASFGLILFLSTVAAKHGIWMALPFGVIGIWAAAFGSILTWTHLNEWIQPTSRDEHVSQ